MKKFTKVLCIGAIIGATFITGCGNKVKDEDVTVNIPEPTEAVTPAPTEEPTPEPTELPTEPAVVDTSGLSDDLYSFQVQLDGVVYALPEDFSVFSENGWTIEDELELEPNSKTLSTVMKNGNKQVYVQFVNLGSDVVDISQCKVSQISLDDYLIGDPVEFILPQGITLGSTRDEVLSAYGDSTDTNDTGSSIFMYYKLDSYSEAKIVLDAEKKIITSIDIENAFEQKTANQVSTEQKDLGAYPVPTALGEDLMSFTVQYDGDFYTLPAPVGAFTNNGWVVESDNAGTDLLDARSSNVRFQLRKGNQVLSTTVTNYGKESAPMNECYVEYLEYYNNGATLPIVLPKGITENSTKDEVIKAYGEPASTDESSSFEYLEYGKYREEIIIMFNKETQQIEKIEVEHSPKDLPY